MIWKKPPETPKTAIGKPSRDELIAQAKAAVAAAKEELGADTIARMQAILLAQQQQKKNVSALPATLVETSPAERARELIKTMDKAKLADYIRATSRED